MQNNTNNGNKSQDGFADNSLELTEYEIDTNKEDEGENEGESETDELASMTLTEHLEELRSRLIKSIMAFTAGTFVGWYLSPFVISYIKHYPQLQDVQIIIIRPAEAFFVRLKAAVIIGILAALPIIIYQIICFVLPALRKHERKWFMRFIPASVLLFYFGTGFSLFVLTPITLDFFLVKMAQGMAVPQISLQEYVNYLASMALVGGLVFQMPILLFFLTAIGVLSSEKLRSGRKIAILLIFITAAFATPPDPFSQVVVALPMIVLYEMCIWASKLAKK